MKQAQKIENYRCLDQEYKDVMNGWPEARTKASFSEKMSHIKHFLTLDFLMIFMAQSWSDPSDAFFLARITFPKDPSPKILPG
jgi:hypothetical protein